MKDSVETELRNVLVDALTIKKMFELHELYYHNQTINQNNLELLQEGLLDFSTNKFVYDQLRFIDKEGMEVIRINYNSGLPSIVPEDKLQNKSSRYYFSEAFAIKPDQLFISPFDLNVERGKIETPLKPMIRIGVPVINKYNEKIGVIILNYLGKTIIDRYNKFNAKTKGVKRQLINDNGYWLSSPFSEDEWGFMYDDKRNVTFKQKYPEESKTIFTENSGQFSSRNGLITFNTIDVLNLPLKKEIKRNHIVSYEKHWKVISILPYDTLYFFNANLLKFFILGLALLTIALWYISWKLSIAIALNDEKNRTYLYLDLLGHDVSNKTQGIISFLQLSLMKKETINSSILNHIKLSLSQAFSIASLVNNVRTLSKLEEQNKLQDESIDALLELNKAIDNVKIAHPDNDLKIEVISHVDNTFVVGGEMLELLFFNLLQNAIKFTDGKNATVKIVISNSEDGKDLKIEFKDKGMGVRSSVKSVIFSRLEQIEKGELGTGLGLAVVKKILNFYKGKIEIEDRVSGDYKQGSNVIIYLEKSQY